MADAEAVMESLPRDMGASYIGLVLNRRGFDRAVAAGVDEINVVVVVTDTFAERNQGTDTDGLVAVWADIADAARQVGLFTSVTLSASFGCPYEGEVPVSRLVEVAERVAAHAPDELALADSIGVAVPTDVARRVDAVREAVGDSIGLRCHFHNTRNTGLANAVAALEAGAALLDASVGGTGGCPFAPRATGNVPTEDLVYLLHGMGVGTGIDLEALMATSRWLGERLGRELPALVTRAGDFPGVSGAAAAQDGRREP